MVYVIIYLFMVINVNDIGTTGFYYVYKKLKGIISFILTVLFSYARRVSYLNTIKIESFYLGMYVNMQVCACYNN